MIAGFAADFLDVLVFLDVDDVGQIIFAGWFFCGRVVVLGGAGLAVLFAMPATAARTACQRFRAAISGGFELGFGGRFFVNQGLAVC